MRVALHSWNLKNIRIPAVIYNHIFPINLSLLNIFSAKIHMTIANQIQ